MTGRRILRTLLACALGVATTTPIARAQLPIPQIEDAPSFNLASADALADAAETLAQTLRRRLEERRAVLAAEDPEPLSEADEMLIARLRSLREEEVATLEEALDLAERARAESRAPVDAAGADGVGELVERRVAVERRRDEAEARAQLADRLEAVTERETEAPAPRDSRRQQIDHQVSQIQIARVERARAQALLASARARRAERAFEAARSRLSVGPDDVADAEERLRSTRAEVEAERARLAEARRDLRKSIAARGPGADEEIETWAYARRIQHDLALSRMDLLDRRDDRLQARLLRARAHLQTTRDLAAGRPVSLTEDLSGAQVQSMLAEVDEHQSGTQLRLVRARQSDADVDAAGRSATRAQNQYRAALEDTLDVLQHTREDLEAIQLMRQLGAPLDALWRPQFTRPVGVGLTALVLALLVLLLRSGSRWLDRHLVADSGAVHRRLPLSATVRKRIGTAVYLVWPIVLTIGAAGGLLYGVWGLQMTPAEVVAWIDRPVFYVDQSPFSALSVLKLLATLWVTFVLARALRVFLSQRLFAQLSVDEGTSTALSTLLYYLALLVGLIIGLNVVGIGFSSLAVLLGVLGIGIGFGLRNITENFISGLIILAERPIQRGDFIDIDGRVEGQVRNIRARSTTVTTRDNISVIIPNSEFVGKQVTNWSHGDPKVRIAVPVGVVYGSDTDLVRRTLLEVASRHGKVLKKPPPEVQFREFGGSSLDFLLLVWIDEQLHRFRISSDLHFAIDKAFRKVGITIAFPQLDLHLMSVSDKAQRAMGVAPAPTTDLGTPPVPDAPTEVTRSEALERVRRRRHESAASRGGGARPAPNTTDIPTRDVRPPTDETES